MSGHTTTETKKPYLHIPEADELPRQVSAEPDPWADDKEVDTFDLFVKCSTGHTDVGVRQTG